MLLTSNAQPMTIFALEDICISVFSFLHSDLLIHSFSNLSNFQMLYFVEDFETFVGVALSMPTPCSQ
jgi:hypothetical protein